MNSEQVALGVLIAIVALTVAFSQPASTWGDKVSVKTESEFHLVRSEGDGDATLEIREPNTGRTASYVMRGKATAYESIEQSESGHFEATYHRDYYLAEPGLDLGVWAGSTPGFGIDAGIRASPARFLYGSVAPDLVVARSAVGAGISLYPPEEVFGYYWRHWGLGGWYAVNTNTGESGPVFGLSFSIKD